MTSKLGYLRYEWDNLWFRLFNSSYMEQRDRVFNILEVAYSRPDRHYHNLDHIAAVLESLPTEGIERLPLIKLAVWFHDVIYNPKNSDNEEASAKSFEGCFRGILPEDSIKRVIDMIACTKTHVAIHDDCQHLIDADLSILGADVHEYVTYARNIRKEYSFVPYWKYVLGRRKVLKRFLARKDIYKTPHFQRQGYDAAARQNINLELLLLFVPDFIVERYFGQLQG